MTLGGVVLENYMNRVTTGAAADADPNSLTRGAPGFIGQAKTGVPDALTASGAGSTTVITRAGTWSANEVKGGVVEILSGPNAEPYQSRDNTVAHVVSNTANALTLSRTFPDAFSAATVFQIWPSSCRMTRPACAVRMVTDDAAFTCTLQAWVYDGIAGVWSLISEGPAAGNVTMLVRGFSPGDLIYPRIVSPGAFGGTYVNLIAEGVKE